MSHPQNKLAQTMDGGKWTENGFTDFSLDLPVEAPFSIYLNDQLLATLMSSPHNMKEMAIGFLASSGVIRSLSQILGFQLDAGTLEGRVTVHQHQTPEKSESKVYSVGCGSAVIYFKGEDIPNQLPVTNPLPFTASRIQSLSKKFNSETRASKPAGGLHAARFCLSEGVSSSVMWDVGRHNAVDKCIGCAMLADWPLENGVVLCSGRVSSEILYKLSHCRIPAVISFGTPTQHAVLLAQNMGIVLIGLARGGHFSIFSHRERVMS